jgi:hypothetical protein
MNEHRSKLATGGPLLFLLVVAAAAGAAGGAAPAGSPSAGGLGVPGWAASTVVALVAGAGTWLAYGVLTGLLRARRPRRRTAVNRLPWWAWLVEAVAAAAAAALLAGLLYLVAHGRPRHAQTVELGGFARRGAVLPHVTSTPGPSVGWVPVAAGAAVALLAVAAYQLLRRRRARLAPMEKAAGAREALQQRRREAVAALELSLDALWAEPDPRKAVIAAYARMDQWLAHAGLGRRPSEAAFEHLDRVMAGLGATAAVGAKLAELFERAKFDRRPCGADMKQAALEALVRLRDELLAPFGGAVPA